MASRPAGKKDTGFYILIVEDSRVQAEILRHILETNGYVTAVAENGKKALDLVARKTPDLIISDVIMPVMNGYDLCKEIKGNSRTADIPFILLTALSDSKDAAFALQSGADNFITKPYQVDYLLRRVRTILGTPRDDRRGARGAKPVTFSHGGQSYEIAPDVPKILDFLLSAYEAAVIQHQEFQRSQRELRATSEKIDHLNQIVSLSNSSLTLDVLLESILKKTLSLQGFEMGAIYLLDPGRTEARMMCYQELVPAYPDLPVLLGTLNIDDVSHKELFTPGIPQFTVIDEDEPTDRDSIILRELGARCYAMLPLTSASATIGVMVLISTKKHEFSAQEKSLLASISTEIGNAVQKTLLLKRLAAANEEANLYLDIMTHDINNVNTAALMFLEIMADKLDDENRKFADIVIGNINQSIEIIGNVSTIRKMFEQEAATKPVELDGVIRSEIQHFSNVTIHYAGTEAVVLADEMLGQVFTNLIGNSSKFCGEDGEITITVGERDDAVLVTVADNGPGISDEMKPLIFDRFRKGKQKSGKGLGLYITRNLVEGYGGRIWAEDRVRGHHDRGAAVCFTMKPAG